MLISWAQKLENKQRSQTSESQSSKTKNNKSESLGIVWTEQTKKWETKLKNILNSEIVVADYLRS